MERQLFTPELNTSEQKSTYLDDVFSRKVSFPVTGMGMAIDFSDEFHTVAMTKARCFGTLAASMAGYNDVFDELFGDDGPIKREDKENLAHEANRKAILRKIEHFRKEHPHAVLSANLMYAVDDYDSMLRTIGESGEVDIRVSAQ